MEDRNRADGDEDEEAERDGVEYEVERLVTREDCAAALRRLADGVANGSVELGGSDAVTAAVPERLELEIEYEQDEEGAELEAELEWPIADGEAVAAERDPDRDEHDDTVETEDGDVETGDADEAREEPAADADAGRPIADVIGAGGAESDARFELFRDRADEWRWRLIHDNGNIIADSGEGYDRKATARNGLESVMRNAPGARIVEDD